MTEPSQQEGDPGSPDRGEVESCRQAGAQALASARPTIVFAVVMAMQGGFFLLALVLGFFFDAPPLAWLTAPGRVDIIWGVVWAVIPVLIVILLLRAEVPFALRLLVKAREGMGPLLRLQLWHLALIALSAGLVEEALFRGVVQTAVTHVLRLRIGDLGAQTLGVLSGALLFGLAHPSSRAYVVVGTLFGVLMGGLFLRTDNLFAPMMAHALYDFLLILYVKYMVGH